MTVEELVAFRAAYERTPMAVKGAFLLRGADGDPHQVRIESARAVELGGGGEERVTIEPTILEIGPTQDTFVPFEVSTLDLLAGWYQLECDVVVDANPGTVRPGPRFAVAWPRGQVRRGTATIDRATGDVRFGALECAGDSIRIAFEAPEVPSLTLAVDGAAHPVLDVEFDEATGSGRIVAYPALRDDEHLSLQVKGHDPIEVALP